MVDRIGLKGVKWGIVRVQLDRDRSLEAKSESRVFIDHRSKHKSGQLRLPQINLANGLTTKQHVKDSVGRSGFEPDRIAMESLTDFPCFSPKRDFSFVLDFSYRYSWTILDGRQAFWKRAQTHLVTRGWHVQVQGLVRT